MEIPGGVTLEDLQKGVPIPREEVIESDAVVGAQIKHPTQSFPNESDRRDTAEVAHQGN